MNIIMDIKTIKKEAKKDIDLSKNLKELDDVYKKYLGKKGEITQVLRSLKDLPERQKKETGMLANKIKKELEIDIKEKKYVFQSADWLANKFHDIFDISVPGKKPLVGHLHPITIVRRKVEEIFQQMGFSVIEGPEVETEWYNFDALNIPKDHPARDAWDTLWLKPENKKLLLRTHTSPVQIRYMKKHQPPLRIIVPGRVFRHEATDASHDVQFYQLEGLMIGKDVSVASFKAIAKEFFQRFFNRDIKIRLRPSFFPFTEPSFEIDISCVNCQGKGCSVCKKTGWVETLGSGMVHPNVLKAVGLNPKFWQGFAFGIGLDRLAMMKYKINDIRLFYSSDLRFLEQF
ncbi:phenylalanine--tRNA ligase subunit alpha [Candidatus Parcubacteria bacterium]|nr:phenylalanine--tRNA ligase subunit alpha [Candidatus Parcubacteria bacterium]